MYWIILLLSKTLQKERIAQNIEESVSHDTLGVVLLKGTNQRQGDDDDDGDFL